ncbi:TPA: hypothetical protein ACGOVD_001836, partial [Streptococcus suis]
GTLVVGGVATTVDSLIQLRAANANLQISFAKGYDDWKNTGKNVNNGDSTKVDSLIKNLKETTNGKGVARNFESSGGYNHSHDLAVFLSEEKIPYGALLSGFIYVPFWTDIM